MREHRVVGGETAPGDGRARPPSGVRFRRSEIARLGFERRDAAGRIGISSDNEDSVSISE
jgi:hypothetical protein